MAKTSMVNRDIKRKKLVKKFATKRAALKATIASNSASYDAVTLLMVFFSASRFVAYFFASFARLRSRFTMLVFAIVVCPGLL